MRQSVTLDKPFQMKKSVASKNDNSLPISGVAKISPQEGHTLIHFKCFILVVEIK